MVYFDAPLDEKWPDVFYAEDYADFIKQTRKISRAHLKALMFLLGGTEVTNKAFLANIHLMGLHGTGDTKSKFTEQHIRELLNVDKITVARMIHMFPACLGHSSTKEAEQYEELFYEGLALNLLAWARTRPSIKMIQAMGHDRIPHRVNVSKTLYAIINGLCQHDMLLPFNNPACPWLLAEASIHLEVMDSGDKWTEIDFEKAALVVQEWDDFQMETEAIAGKQVYRKFYQIVLARSEQLSKRDEAFRRGRWARHKRALKAWIKEQQRLKKQAYMRVKLRTSNEIAYGKRNPGPPISTLTEVR